MHEVNHTTGEATDTSRNVLLESARIARGKVAHLQVQIGTSVNEVPFLALYFFDI